MTITKHCIYALIALALAACSTRPHDVSEVTATPDIYPDYKDVEVPATIAPLNFCMADEDVERIDVTVSGANGGELNVNSEYADFDVDEWHELLAKNIGESLTVSVCAMKQGKWTRYADFIIHVSSDTMDDWGVTYRLVAPGYEIYGKMGIYQRSLSDFNEKPLIVTTQTPKTCVNCHTTNKGNISQSVMHSRGAHGATLMRTNGNLECLAAKNPQLGSTMVYPYWHPEGKYCAFSTNDTQQKFHSKAEKLIEVFDTKSDIALYNTATHEIMPILADTTMAENCPAFSADGTRLYYLSAPIVSMPANYDKMRYSLYAVDFNPSTGTVGQTPIAIIHADSVGRSISWPRPSYDGRYIMYTSADYGYFTIWHPEADLWLYDMQTGEHRTLDAVNSDRADSYHAWSTNSRWFLFTSRRDDDLYTRLYFAHIDEQGNVSKPFMLPQQNPHDDNVMRLYSYNTPDFIGEPYDISSNEISDILKDDKRSETIYKYYINH